MRFSLPRKSIYILLIGFILFLPGMQTIAQSVHDIVLTDGQEVYPLGLHLEILEDKEKEWTIDDVISPEISAKFEPSQEETPGFGFTDSAYWVRFQVRNEANADVDWLILYDSIAFNIDYYYPIDSNEEVFEVVNTGTTLPFETRDIPNKLFAFRLPLAPQETKTIYMRFSSEGSLILSLKILDDLTFSQQSLQEYITISILYGILIIIGVYHFIFFITLRDYSYLLFVLFISSILIAVMALDGFAAQYLWPNQGGLFTAAAPRIFTTLSVAIALLFSTAYLRTHEYTFRLHKVMIGLAAFLILFVGLLFIWFIETGFIHAVLALIGSIMMIIAGVMVWRKGYEPARFFLFAWFVVLVALILFSLSLIDFIPTTGLSGLVNSNLLRIGLVILAITLSFGLSYRINLYRQERLAAQLALSRQRVEIAQDLHDSVTQSLYSANLFAEAGRETLEMGDVSGAGHYFNRIGQTTLQALKEMRLFLYELRPPDVAAIGLVDAIQKRLDAVEMRSGTEVRLLLAGSPSFTPEISDQFYRIAQEALNNVLKHAQADHVTVYLRSEEGMMDLEIVDDGCGFDLEQAGNGGMGLRTMQERAETINGRFTIHSQPGEGTSVKVEVGNHHE